jgi:hypothetical protein
MAPKVELTDAATQSKAGQRCRCAVKDAKLFALTTWSIECAVCATWELHRIDSQELQQSHCPPGEYSPEDHERKAQIRRHFAGVDRIRRPEPEKREQRAGNGSSEYEDERVGEYQDKHDLEATDSCGARHHTSK